MTMTRARFRYGRYTVKSVGGGFDNRVIRTEFIRARHRQKPVAAALSLGRF